MSRLWPIVVLALLLVGCETAKSPRRDLSWLPTVDAGLRDVERLLEFHQRAVTLKGPELAREYDRARLAFEKDASELHRVRLALMLSIPGAAFRDDAAAIGLLQPILKDRREPESHLRPLAQLLQSYVLEMRRADDALQAQSAKLREEQRRAEALQQKLEALLEMEMKMIEREQSAQPRRR
ncbi:MAG: hypothetical protein ACREU7_04800 [Burkholderiales bacterium]